MQQVTTFLMVINNFSEPWHVLSLSSQERNHVK